MFDLTIYLDVKYFLTIRFLTETTQNYANFVATLLVIRFLIMFAHTSDRYISVIELYLSEIWAKNNWKTNDSSSVATKFAQFWVVSVRKGMVKKYLISDRFSFLDRFFSPRCFDNSVRAFFILFGQEGVCNFKIT